MKISNRLLGYAQNLSQNVQNLAQDNQPLARLAQEHITGLYQNAVSQVESKAAKAVATTWFGGDAKSAYERYRKLYDLGAILQCEYAVHVYDIYNIQGASGVTIPWFSGQFPLSWLASEVDVSLGSLETESYHAGAYQCAYVTGQSSSTIDVTFIETRNMDISKSYQLCRKLATPKDGTVNVPKRYAFEIIISVFGKNPRNYQAHAVAPIFEVRHIVCVKEANISLSSTGRSEIIKVNVTFEKVVPHDIYANSRSWNTKKLAQNLALSFM